VKAQLLGASGQFGPELLACGGACPVEPIRRSRREEADEVGPLGVYSAAKAARETSVRKNCLKRIVARTSWVYGAFGNVFLKTMFRLTSKQDEIQVVADQRGCRSGTEDLAATIVRIMPRLIEFEGSWGAYQFAGSRVATLCESASEIMKAKMGQIGGAARPTAASSAQFPTATRRPTNSELDSEPCEKTFGFRAIDRRERPHPVVKLL